VSVTSASSSLGVGSTQRGGQPLLEAAGIEAAKDGSASTREQRRTPRFPSENGAPICPGESRRVRSVWSFLGVGWVGAHPWPELRLPCAAPLPCSFVAVGSGQHTPNGPGRTRQVLNGLEK
jgi:hypothetical protein